MAIRNYGPVGCAVSLLLLVGVGALLLWLAEGRMSSGPPQERITGAAESLIRRAMLDRTIDTLTVTGLHPRRERWAWTVTRWAVTGDIAYTDEASSVEDDFIAVIRLVCERYVDPKCWTLAKLSVGGEVFGTGSGTGS